MDRARPGIRLEGAVLVALVVAPAAEFVVGRGFAGFAKSDGHGVAGRSGKTQGAYCEPPKTRVRRSGNRARPLAHCRFSPFR
jgi:hypothetical protein